MKRFLTLTGAAVLSLGSTEVIVGAVAVVGAGAGAYGLYKAGKKMVKGRRNTIEVDVPTGDPVIITVPGTAPVDPDNIPTDKS